ncbi:MAG: YerC/YecD family TrpR-related protein [Patescibacteria group bacterium]|nr:helix-turn-helix domain-containing protein [Patescibacteria group bacterium]
MTEKDLQKKEMKKLFEAFAKLKTAKECRDFMRDICTLSELNAMAERLQVVKMVADKTPYREISKKTGASTATITRVAHWLHHGMGGYELVLKRLKT